MAKLNYFLILVGLLVSVATSIYAARPWGDNYAYQEASGYFILLLFELWIVLPFLVLFRLNKVCLNSLHYLKLMFFVCIIVADFAAYIYVDSILTSSGSTSALIFVFLPIYQLSLLGAVIVFGWIASKLLKGPK